MVVTRIGAANIANTVSIFCSSPSANARERAERRFVPGPKSKFKPGHWQIQIRPQGVKTGHYRGPGTGPLCPVRPRKGQVVMIKRGHSRRESAKVAACHRDDDGGFEKPSEGDAGSGVPHVY